MLQHTVDITELHQHRQPDSAAGVIQRAEVVQERNRWLQDAFLQTPVALVILRGPRHIVEVVNERACAMWGRTRERVQDKPLLDAVPEIARQGVRDVLETLWRTEQLYVRTELPVELLRAGKRELIYVTFVYQPMFGVDGPRSPAIFARRSSPSPSARACSRARRRRAPRPNRPTVPRISFSRR